jgi:predicted acylesterase/phospholipase RssA
MPTRTRPVHGTRIARSLRVVRPDDRIRDFAGRLQLQTVPIDGVLQGGAALGTAYLGGLALLEQNRLWFGRIAGNSAGAITAAMIAAGYRGPEIEWLCSAFAPTPPRPAGVPASQSPIDFLDFLDFPTLNSIGTPARRKTLLWRALKGEVIDKILDTKIPIATQAQVVNAAVNGLKALPVVGQAVAAAETPVPLAVIGANIKTGHMEVYSSGKTPNMEVAEAVRRSMSLPLIFQPRGTTVVDGGLCSNFPAWLFTPAGNEHWPSASFDPQRPIVGFALNESQAAPASWNAAPGKFSLTGNPPHVDLKDVRSPL